MLRLKASNRGVRCQIVCKRLDDSVFKLVAVIYFNVSVKFTKPLDHILPAHHWFRPCQSHNHCLVATILFSVKKLCLRQKWAVRCCDNG